MVCMLLHLRAYHEAWEQGCQSSCLKPSAVQWPGWDAKGSKKKNRGPFPDAKMITVTCPAHTSHWAIFLGWFVHILLDVWAVSSFSNFFEDRTARWNNCNARSCVPFGSTVKYLSQAPAWSYFQLSTRLQLVLLWLTYQHMALPSLLTYQNEKQ